MLSWYASVGGEGGRMVMSGDRVRPGEGGEKVVVVDGGWHMCDRRG
jgi:hypothetical protein